MFTEKSVWIGREEARGRRASTHVTCVIVVKLETSMCCGCWKCVYVYVCVEFVSSICVCVYVLDVCSVRERKRERREREVKESKSNEKVR